MNNLIRLVDGQARIIADDPWVLCRDVEQTVEQGQMILPLPMWREWHQDGGEVSQHGVWLSPDDEPESLQSFLPRLPLIALDFPSFRDGRAYSQAYVLRTRMGWGGELRAVGDVLRDQLSHMRQCGFDAFAVRADKSVDDALKGLFGLSVQYGRSVLEPRPLFRRR